MGNAIRSAHNSAIIAKKAAKKRLSTDSRYQKVRYSHMGHFVPRIGKLSNQAAEDFLIFVENLGCHDGISDEG